MTKILFVCLGNICRSPMAETAPWNEKNIEPRKCGYDEYGCSSNHTPRF